MCLTLETLFLACKCQGEWQPFNLPLAPPAQCLKVPLPPSTPLRGWEPPQWGGGGGDTTGIWGDGLGDDGSGGDGLGVSVPVGVRVGGDGSGSVRVGGDGLGVSVPGGVRAGGVGSGVSAPGDVRAGGVGSGVAGAIAGRGQAGRGSDPSPSSPPSPKDFVFKQVVF